MKFSELDGLRVGLWGYGREGRAALRWLRERHPSAALVVVSDQPLASAATAELAALSPPLSALSGTEGLAALRLCDVVIKSPGISRYRPDCTDLKLAGVVVTTGTDLWFAEHPQDLVVAVTGSKGKSTTASLIAHMLRVAGRPVVLAGNVGVPLLSVTGITEPQTVYVVELSSYQISDLTHPPTIGVLLNLYPEHADWHGSTERYFADKLNLFRQQPQCLAVANHGDERVRHALAEHSPIRWYGSVADFHVQESCIRRDQVVVLRGEDLPLRGQHNLVNMCAALTVAEELGLPETAWREGAGSFEPLPHRLQEIVRSRDLSYVDDSISTIPEAAVAAIEALRGRPLTLLSGGYDRGQDYHELASAVQASLEVVGVVGLPDNGERVLEAVRAVGSHRSTPPVTMMARNIEEAVALASRLTPAEGIVLLSPGAPSFGQFANFEERGNAFRDAAVQHLRG